MLQQFILNIEKQKLIANGQKVLLTVSGGIDSMVMLDLFEKSNFRYGVAHCNFRLRGEESDGDEQFVREQVQQHGIVSYFKDFDTREYARLNGISIEMAARELRYGYFEKLRVEHGYDFIATAHHQDDLIETFFLNLVRKTGIKGLTGIKEKSGNVIRPLLFAGRSEIEAYARENFLDYREDSSNNEIVFQRNFIRHKILPLFSELSPSFKKNFLASVSNLKDASRVYSFYMNREKASLLTEDRGQFLIDIEALKKSPFPKIVLLETLSVFNFNPAVVEEVYQSLSASPGKQFFSKTHRLVRDREQLFISEIKETEEKIYYVEAGDRELAEPLDISLGKKEAKDFTIVRDPRVACIDLDTVQFPLLIRKWKQGDYFYPLGMNGMKKVSDFFIDRKVPLHEKENTWLLCSGRKIIWIMGYRIDDRFKITEKTAQVLEIKIKN